MGYNTFETIDNGLRGEAQGQLTPEGQKLWDEYQSLLAGQKNPPMANLRLRSGATMPIIEPGYGLKNRMLSKTLGGMTGTGLGTRAAAQPGLFAQLAPLFIAAGIKDPKQIKKLMDMFSGGSDGASPTDAGSLASGDMSAANDWDNAFSGYGGDGAIGLGDIGDLGTNIPDWTDYAGDTTDLGWW